MMVVVYMLFSFCFLLVFFHVFLVFIVSCYLEGGGFFFSVSVVVAVGSGNVFFAFNH